MDKMVNLKLVYEDKIEIKKLLAKDILWCKNRIIDYNMVLNHPNTTNSNYIHFDKRRKNVLNELNDKRLALHLLNDLNPKSFVTFDDITGTKGVHSYGYLSR